MKASSPYWFFAAALAAVFTTMFLVAAALHVTLLDDPAGALAAGGASAAALGVVLLVADALLPIPASLVMISLGALFGPVLGVALSLAGRFGMAIVGFAIGRRAGPLLARATHRAERARAEALIERWGALAIVVSRPVPIVAETVTIMAGAAGVAWRRALLAAFAGSVPEAVAYGLTGALAASFDNAALVWLAFLVVAGLFRLLEHAQRRRRRRTSAAIASTTAAPGR
jgi:uncharacterized membrane protein YdjX (TVP38/TMEM64 family)